MREADLVETGSQGVGAGAEHLRTQEAEGV